MCLEAISLAGNGWEANKNNVLTKITCEINFVCNITHDFPSYKAVISILLLVVLYILHAVSAAYNVSRGCGLFFNIKAIFLGAYVIGITIRVKQYFLLKHSPGWVEKCR